MKFKLLESVKTFNGGAIQVTYSSSDASNIMSHGEYRVLYDTKEGLWIIADPLRYIHRDMIKAAYDNNVYKDQEDYINTNCRGDIEIYYEVGDSGDDYVHDREVDIYIWHLYSISNDQLQEIGTEGLKNISDYNCYRAIAYFNNFVLLINTNGYSNDKLAALFKTLGNEVVVKDLEFDEERG